MSRGIAGERRVAHALREAGYLVASRRHEGGAGDILAAHPVLERSGFGILLIEAKATWDIPWCCGSFGPGERRALIETAHRYGAIPLLAWLPPGIGTPIWLPPGDWPDAQS